MTHEDSFNNYGFLSREALSRRHSEKPAGKEDLEVLREIVRIALDGVRKSPEFAIPNDEGGHAWWRGTIFWIRALEACQATVLLADMGMAGSAISTLRTGFECMFTACALWRHPELASAIDSAHDEARRKQIDAMRRSPPPWATPEYLAELDALPAVTKGTPLQIQQVAEKADLTWLYDHAYRGLSLVGAHATMISAERYIVFANDSEQWIYMGPQFGELGFILGGVSQCLQPGIERFGEEVKKFSPPPNPE